MVTAEVTEKISVTACKNKGIKA